MYAWIPAPELKHDCSVAPCPVCESTRGPAMEHPHQPERKDEPNMNGLCV
jgi:hypothetical protein